MKTFNGHFAVDKTRVKVEGLAGWHKVSSINLSRNLIEIEGYAGSWQRGHVDHWTNSFAGKLEFLEFIGGASTSAYVNGRYFGHDVNATAYETADGAGVVIKLETNGAPARGVPFKTMGKDEYDEWKDSCPQSLSMLLYGIRLFENEKEPCSPWDTNCLQSEYEQEALR